MGGAPAFLFLWTLLRLLRRVVFVFLDFRDFLGHRLLEIRRGIRVIERLLELLEALVRLFEVVGVEDESSPQSRACIKIIKDFDLTIQLFTDKGSFAYENSISLQQDMEAVISRNMGQPADVELLPAITASELNEFTILKMEIMSLDETKLYQCQSALKANSDLLLTSSVRGNLEITHKAANKGAALSFILERLKLRKEEVIIFGDSMNDASLFEYFPNTVAVKNAHPYILGLAKAVCEACEEDGVGKWLAANLCL